MEPREQRWYLRSSHRIPVVGSVAYASIEASHDAFIKLGKGCAPEDRALALEDFHSMKLKKLRLSIGESSHLVIEVDFSG